MNQQNNCDVLIIGSGAAGLTLALHLAKNADVVILSKGPLNEGSTYYAQGGIAAVFDENDSVQAHVSDTIIAGAGLCDENAVQYTAENAKACLQWLIEQGVDFDKEDCDKKDFDNKNNTQGEQKYHLTREGGHSHRRILHAADATGKAIQTTLSNRVKQHSRIRVFERCNAIDLICEKSPDELNSKSDDTSNSKKQCIGAYIWNRNSERVESIYAQKTILATGGASKVYQYTSNPDVASGDGIAMAWRAGCRVANMEFNQFHPTCLFHPDAGTFLLTEALRGEGAKLRRPDGSRFMPAFDKRAELAPRDIVARAIDYEMKRLGVDCMYLDISHQSSDFIQQHFPTIYQRTKDLGIDITKQPIPIVPAAHYTCGGVMIDQHGRTDVHQLYAIGEMSYTGLHGANRLASNSLLECLVYARAAALEISESLVQHNCFKKLPHWDESRVTDSDEEVVIQHNWHELRLFMWDYVGIVRTTKRLERALHRVELLQQEIQDYYRNFKVSNNLLELRNLVQVAELIIRCALERKESRGLHYTLDFPETLAEAKPTILRANNSANKSLIPKTDDVGE